jgi:site-specific recombinase XerD
MKDKIMSKIQLEMSRSLSSSQLTELHAVLIRCLSDADIVERSQIGNPDRCMELMDVFLSSKRIEGCSEKSLSYYKSTIQHMAQHVRKEIRHIETDDLRSYLALYQSERGVTKVTIDNIRRILSSFFGWLEDEDYIVKSPVRRIHRVKADRVIRETISDEGLEKIRDACDNLRDLAMVDMLASTGMRVGELVRLNRDDIDFHERQCAVFGKGNSERMVYFDARTKIHLKSYLDSRTDTEVALFVSLAKPNQRLEIGGIGARLRKLGATANVQNLHPHKFRRTLATKAIDKGMPIEQVQTLLGHVKIDTTMHYAMVNQANVKIAHRRYIG